MKRIGILTALRTGLTCWALPLRGCWPAWFMSTTRPLTICRNARWAGLGQSGNGLRFGSLNSRDKFTEWQWLTVSGSAALYPM